MREIVIRKGNAIVIVVGELFTGAFDDFGNPVFENDDVIVEAHTGFGSATHIRAKVAWCEDHARLEMDTGDSVFDGELGRVVQVVNEKAS